MTLSTSDPSRGIIPNHTLTALTTAWRADGAPDDWWQECFGTDGKVYDVNIYDAGYQGNLGFRHVRGRKPRIVEVHSHESY